MKQEEITKRLCEPFAFGDVKLEIQSTSRDKTKGTVIARITDRAVYKRLDEAVGAFDWKNEIQQIICGLSVYDSERGEWVTKYGDSFNDAANVWGIGRYLDELGAISVEIERRGDDFVIKDNQYAKLEAEYNKLFGEVKVAEQQAPVVPDTPEVETPETSNTEQPPEDNATKSTLPVYFVKSVKSSGGQSRILELFNSTGETISAYVKKNNDNISNGTKLTDVDMEQKNSSYGFYNIIKKYRIIA